MSIKDASGKIIIRTIGACIVLFFNNCLSRFIMKNLKGPAIIRIFEANLNVLKYL